MHEFSVARPPGFSLAAHSAFYASFTPSSGMAAAGTGHGQLTFSFRLDGTFEATVVALREEGGSIHARFVGPSDATAVKRQVSRILGLECDGAAWLALGKKNPVVGALQSKYPGFYTATFPSPYDAAVWDMFATRTPQKRAAQLKAAFAAEHGDVLTLDFPQAVFPGPRALLEVSAFPGLAQERMLRLQSVAKAALEGKLDAERLRTMPEAEAIALLETIRGVGEWTSNHVLKRGAGPPDAAPTPTPPVCELVGQLAGLAKTPSPQEVLEISEAWSPFRMWVTVLLARALADQPGGRGWKMTGAQLSSAKRAARR